uniref:Ankyrin repeat domain-containing protein 39 n=1 Tax=Timema douglasi TaxID=61478 RepID=A0A7R8VNI5_TIMDO|nr:unnamed protein product [Timema douglasi]
MLPTELRCQTDAMSHEHSHECTCPVTSSSVQQTLDELDFERGIWFAAQHDDIERVEKLLSKGTPVDTRDSAGYTALHYAARAGHTGMCERLISAGADVNATTRSGSATPLHRAAAAGRLQVVKLLLRSGADASSIDADGKNALHRAVSGGHIEVAEALAKVKPVLKDIVDKRGNLPLHYAGSNTELGELLK